MEGVFAEDQTEKPQLNKKFWAYIKSTKTEGLGVSALKIGGKLITDAEDRTELLGKQFSSVFSPKDQISEEEFHLRCPSAPDSPIYPSCNNPEITVKGVEKLLKNLNPSKAQGPDGLSPRVLQMIAKVIAPAFTTLSKSSLNTGISCRLKSICHPVFKKGERYKAMHKKNKNILRPEQHGFRKGHS